VESLSGCAWNGCPSQRGIRTVIFLGERPSGQAWFGISLIGAGVIVLALSSARNGA